MILTQCDLHDVFICKSSLNWGIVEARILVTETEAASSANTTDIEIRNRVCSQDGAVELG
jgi:hypothetical protein